MEKKKTIGLQRYFTKSILFAGFSVVVIIVFWVFLFFFSIEFGFISPANAGENEAKQFMASMEKSDKFIENLKPDFSNYIYISSNGEILESSYNLSEAQKVLQEYISKGEEPSPLYGKIIFKNGNYCVFIWKYNTLFTNSFLRRMFPSAGLVYGFLMFVSLVLFLVVYIKRMSRKFGKNLSSLENASNQIAAQNLEDTINTNSGIKEFDSVLDSMENVRFALKTSLSEQWLAEEQRKQEIASLTHDIKTPLTIIKGNSELLMESTLTNEQFILLESIYKASNRVEDYIELLQQISNFNLQRKEKEVVSLRNLIDDLLSVFVPLALPQNIEVNINGNNPKEVVEIYKDELMRALINVGENAINYTDKNGYVDVHIEKEDGLLIITFFNSGSNFSKEALIHATEMLWQEKKSRSESKHYGMGLAFVKKVVQLHNGELEIFNTDGGAVVKLIIECR